MASIMRAALAACALLAVLVQPAGTSVQASEVSEDDAALVLDLRAAGVPDGERGYANAHAFHVCMHACVHT